MSDIARWCNFNFLYNKQERTPSSSPEHARQWMVHTGHRHSQRRRSFPRALPHCLCGCTEIRRWARFARRKADGGGVDGNLDRRFCFRRKHACPVRRRDGRAFSLEQRDNENGVALARPLPSGIRVYGVCELSCQEHGIVKRDSKLLSVSNRHARRCVPYALWYGDVERGSLRILSPTKCVVVPTVQVVRRLRHLQWLARNRPLPYECTA